MTNTYEAIFKILQDQKIYPDIETKDGTITALHVQAFPERADEICESLKIVLEGVNVSLNKMPNQNYIAITLKK